MRLVLTSLTLLMYFPLVTSAQEAGFPTQPASQLASLSCAAPCDPSPALTGKFTPYFWVTRMNGDIGKGPVTAPVHVTLGEMWHLITHEFQMGFLGQLELNYGRVGFLANGAYFELTPGGELQNLNFASTTSQTALDLVFTYNLLPTDNDPCPDPRWELLAGTRYYALTGDLTITGPRGNAVSFTGARDWWDPIVGTRVTLPLNEAWSVQARGDVGGFGINGCSRLSWNIELAALYHCSDRIDLMAGYRWLDANYRRGEGVDRFLYDVQSDGPMVGLTFKF
jgi:hypothetical protein